MKIRHWMLVAALAIPVWAGCNQSTESEIDWSQVDLPEINDVVLSPAELDATVAKSDRAVLLKFGAPWCPPCNMLDAELPKVAHLMGDKVEVLKVNVDENQDLASQYDVSSIPKIILFRDGKAVSNRVGFMDVDKLSKWIANTE